MASHDQHGKQPGDEAQLSLTQYTHTQASHHRHGKQPQAEKDWVVHIKNALVQQDDQQERRESMPSPSIFMAPAPLRGLKHEAFIPQVVPIGPYHCDVGPHHSSFPSNHESERYIAIAATEMEKHKIMAAKYVQKSFINGFTVVKLAEKFEATIAEIRQEYDSDMACNQSNERLAFMVALDACFVVEVLKCNAAEAHLKEKPKPILQRGSATGRQPSTTRSPEKSANDAGFDKYYCMRFPLPLRKSILQDFVMLENQIPLFCLFEVMSRMDDAQKEGSGRPAQDSMKNARKIIGDLFVEIAMDVLPFTLDKHDKLECIHKHIGARKHLLDCLYAIVTHAVKHTTKSELVLKPTHFPRAVELHHSGISFKAVEKGNMLEVRFDEKTATLFVPKVRVGDDTERLFRNLIAYESHIIDNVHVLSYLRFMNNLVDDAKDVALLIQKGILVEDIGSDEEVADMWNNLCVNTMRVCSDPYEKVAHQLMNHCERNVNMWKAELKRTYFSKPWLPLSLFSGWALLSMTLIIMLYTIFLFKKHE